MGQFSGPPPITLSQLLEVVELRLTCASCSKRQKEDTYTVQPAGHDCTGSQLLAKRKNGNADELWRLVKRRPSFPVPARYSVCWYYQPGKGCTKHRQRCTFAWNEEERLVWAFEKSCDLDRSQLKAILLPTKSTGTALRAPASWEDILEEFGGDFQEVCESCFYQSPPKVTLCIKCRTHPRPVPLLAHMEFSEHKKQCHAIRQKPHIQPLRLCRLPSRGLLCPLEAGHCPYAHSLVELAVWKAEQEFGLSRGQVVRRSEVDVGFYCRLCLVSASTQEGFEVHCASLEHRRMMAADSLTVWNHRAPPINIKDVALCESPQPCVYGNVCPKAHSKEELEEWMMRMKVGKRNRQVAEAEGLQPYQDRLIQEYQLYSADMQVLSEEVEGVKISSDLPLRVLAKEKPAKRTWTFTVHTKMPLLHVALLKMDPGASFSLVACGIPKPCNYARGSSFQRKSPKTLSFEVKVLVECAVFGLFEQWLALDFGTRPVLVQKIFLQVGGQTDAVFPAQNTSCQETEALPPAERWYSGKKLFVPCKERTQEEKQLGELYKQPAVNVNHRHESTDTPAFTAQNYRKRMHEWLLQEEAAREQVLSRLNMRVSVTLSKMMNTSMGMKFCSEGELFGEVPLPPGITQDTEEGYLLHRSVDTALLALFPPQDDKVYEVCVDSSAGLERSVLLQIPERCCRELALEKETAPQMEIQFQLNRFEFCVNHDAVDRLLDVKLLFPELSKCCPPTTKEKLSWGNSKQRRAASYIIGAVPEGKPVAPLLIYGPFGTGKTYIMAKAALEVVKKPGTRVLICTHNNSAADLYVREHFHAYVESGHPEAKPLRVKYIQSPLNRTDLITLQYCPVKDSAFFFPDLGYLEQYRIIVTTAVTSRDLAVSRGYFSHIFLDETAQMLESEALIPLALADKMTRIVIAGDHMQETPRQFSWGKTNFHEEHTLLTRLFSHYQRENSPTAKAARVIFHQNYRSVPAIISFVSRCFYVGQDDAIEACGTEATAPPADRHALGLCHVHGSCTRDGSSWVNQAEVLQVLEVVRDVLNRWSESWGATRRSSICVLSQGSQVRLIRQELRKIKLSDVTVTNYTDIIGREFQVIILSTVRSVDSLSAASAASSNFTLDVFCDPRVLNTILTRARSQIIVVGDMVALCSFGYCSRIWRRYVRESVEKGSASPPDLSVEEIKQAACSLQAWQGRQDDEEEAEDSDSWISDPDINMEDSILQELLNSKTEAIVTVTDEGMMEVCSVNVSDEKHQHKREVYTDFPLPTLKQLLQSHPNDYKRCLLVKKSFNSGYALTLDDRPRQIPIEGRLNCGLAFSGDEVLVQLPRGTDPQAGKVVGLMKTREDCRRFVCFMDPHDNSIMVPIDRSITKIFCLMLKERPGLLPIRSFSNGQIKTHTLEKVTPEMKSKRLFLVQVVKWTKEFTFPMGIVNCILPVINTTEEGLNVLDLEFRLDSPEKYPEKATKEAKKILSRTLLNEGRQDCRNLITFTIDPASAKDLDDAISVRELGDHYEIGVHISDVATLVSPGSELDKEANARGVTFYRPEAEAIHMLPMILSCDFLSLKPQCDRRALSLFVKVEKNTDQMVDFHFCRTLIRSDRQLSYEEATSILSTRCRQTLSFSSMEDCIRTAWHFAQVHCRSRLREASTYKRPDENSSPGSENAKRMIEELMIMYNSFVAEYLCEQKALKHLVPVRCQAQPSLQNTMALRKKLSHLVHLSTHLSYYLLEAPEPQKQLPGVQVTMRSSVWKRIQDAAKKEDYATVADLLCTDDLHPELCYATIAFRKHLGRVSIRRCGTSGPSGHFSLNLSSYTWASSPIRRYLDIVIQRLLLCTLAGTRPQISASDVELLCHNFDRRVKQEASYKKQSLAMQLALAFRTEVQQKMAVVVSVESNNKEFKVVFPLNGDSLSDLLSIDYNMLQPTQQPEGIVGGTCLLWRRRVYSYHRFRELPLRNNSQRDVTVFGATAWRGAITAVNEGSPEKALSLLKKGMKTPVSTNHVKRSKCGHYVEMTLDLRPGVALLVQLCATIQRGIPTPSPQLCSPCPYIQLCLEHTLQPVDCFSKQAHRAPLKHYKSPGEYQQVWQPLCALEAVSSAISESGGILLRDVPVKWKKEGTNIEAVGLKGSFKVSADLIKECDLDLDFHHCYLCVRLENLPASHSATLLDPQTFTWVAHGLTDTKTDKQEEGWKVKFYIHQSTMCHVPEAAFRSTAQFTLEIIPKLLPDM
ncbi:helicase with zinc finger domain 2 isoform X2 [Spea bombifrons]|uniref:helicase with zinc finger domain 2 isoform X2 n=1 Tax=Spea bombifrons TaxID=233779 RepID=UPI00234A0C8A|nr:helicase with zinc finger domain 2 isoform X2 [Spea bombifrons]